MKRPWHLACVPRTSVVLCAGLWLVACGKDEPTNAMAGAGAAPAAGTGAAGMTGGSAGTGAAGSGTGGVPTCATAKKGTPAELHAAALAAMAPSGGAKNCAFSSCHDSIAKKAGLTLIETMDLKTQLIGKTACEAPTLKLIDTSGGDAALAKSWLWQKLTAPVDASGVLTAKPEWGTPVETCSQQPGQGFGLRMPMGIGTMLHTESKLQAIRDWICAGAAGP